jgi:hypothetical protein
MTTSPMMACPAWELRQYHEPLIVDILWKNNNLVPIGARANSLTERIRVIGGVRASERSGKVI